LESGGDIKSKKARRQLGYARRGSMQKSDGIAIDNRTIKNKKASKGEKQKSGEVCVLD
jgi:hypothetical protein